MEPTLVQQTWIFLWSFVLGAALCVVYLVIALLRIVFPPGKWRLFTEDALFVFFCGVINFLFALSLTEGTVRYYSLLAQILAFTVLYLTLGRWILRFSFVIVGFVLKVYHLFADPIGRVFKNLSKYTVNSCQILLKKIKNIKN